MTNKIAVIDAHIHHYPAEVAKRPAMWAKERGEIHWGNLMEANTLQAWPTLEALLTDMKRAQIQHAILQGWYWEHLSTCIWHNNWQSTWVKDHPKQLTAFASVQPLAGEAALDALRKAYDDGLRGIGEVFPAAQGFTMKHPTWLKMVTWATERKMPITLHVPEPVGHRYAGKISAALSDYQWLAETFPETTFIFAHWGGLLPFYELNAHCKKIFKNVYYDTAASPLLYNKRIYQTIVDLIGSERILFGTDYPLKTFPKKQRVQDFEHALKEVLTAGLSKKDEENLLAKNALQLLDAIRT